MLESFRHLLSIFRSFTVLLIFNWYICFYKNYELWIFFALLLRFHLTSRAPLQPHERTLSDPKILIQKTSPRGLCFHVCEGGGGLGWRQWRWGCMSGSHPDPPPTARPTDPPPPDPYPRRLMVISPPPVLQRLAAPSASYSPPHDPCPWKKKYIDDPPFIIWSFDLFFVQSTLITHLFIYLHFIIIS